MNARPALILSLGLFLGLALLAWAQYSSRLPRNTIEATGSARVRAVADVAKWRGSISRTLPEAQLMQGFARMRDDLAALQAFFRQAGLAENAVEIQPVTMEPVYQSNPSAPPAQTLRQHFTATSQDTARLAALAMDHQALLDQGVLLTTTALEYYVSRLPEMRVEMLGQAVKDARRRAGEIARSDGRDVGPLQSARIGVVQVLAPDSVDVSGAGAYDTSTPEKEVMVTVRAEFAVR